MIPSTTLSWRQFVQGTSRAKKLAAEGPVFITERGTPSYVLLTVAQYRQLAGSRGAMVTDRRKYNLADLMAQCDLSAARPAEMDQWDTAPAVGREVL